MAVICRCGGCGLPYGSWACYTIHGGDEGLLDLFFDYTEIEDDQLYEVGPYGRGDIAEA